LLGPDVAATGPKGGAARLHKYGATAQQKCQQLVREAKAARQVKVFALATKERASQNWVIKSYNFWANSDIIQQELCDLLREYQPAMGQPTV
jgi:hypothetical protein